MRRKNIIYILAAVIALVLILTGVKAKLEANLESLADSTITNVELSKVQDGIYSGSHSAFPVAVEVEVKVENHRIMEIKLKKHNNGQGAAAEVITDKVVEAQTLEVDTIAGATYSSKVILRAIEDALSGVKQ